LRHKPPPAAPSRLSEDERARLPELLARGAKAHGFGGEVWTCERVAIEMFGFPRLRALVAEHGEKRSLSDSLLEQLCSFVGEGWKQEYNITLLMLKRSASPN
jgi:hypothetical protein